MVLQATSAFGAGCDLHRKFLTVATGAVLRWGHIRRQYAAAFTVAASRFDLIR